MKRTVRWGLISVALLVVLLAKSAGSGVLIPVQIRVGTMSVSKLPFLIAKRENLFAKYGLDADLWVTPAGSKYGAVREWLLGEPDIGMDGATPQLVASVEDPEEPMRVFIGGTDCVVRAHIIGRRDLETIEDLRGGRIGISTKPTTTTGFVALWLARRQGWEVGTDLEIVLDARDVPSLESGVVDAIVATEFRYEEARRAGFSILEDTRDWDMPIGGNSVKVAPEWLASPENRDTAKRVLMALTEALAIFHENRDRTLEIIESLPRVTDREYAETVWERGATLSRVPTPCIEGIELTMELYDSPAMRSRDATDFYDDSLMQELIDEGFVEDVYRAVRTRR